MAKEMKPPPLCNGYCFVIALLFIGFFSSSFSFYKFRMLRLREEEGHRQSGKQNYYVVAEWLVFVPPVIMCIALVICLISNGKGSGKLLISSSYTKSNNVLRDYMNMDFLIGLARVVALLMACFQSCQIGIISEKSSSTGFYAVLGLLVSSFCLAEYMALLDKFGVMPEAVECDLGFFKFTTTSSLCAVQYVYGSGKYMAITYVLSMILNLIHGSIMTTSRYMNQLRTTTTAISTNNDDDSPPSIAL